MDSRHTLHRGRLCVPIGQVQPLLPHALPLGPHNWPAAQLLWRHHMVQPRLTAPAGARHGDQPQSEAPPRDACNKRMAWRMHLQIGHSLHACMHACMYGIRRKNWAAPPPNPPLMPSPGQRGPLQWPHAITRPFACGPSTHRPSMPPPHRIVPVVPNPAAERSILRWHMHALRPSATAADCI